MLTSLFLDIPVGAMLVRMFATALVVMSVTWSVGKFGPLIGGALAGLPIVLGPGLYFLVLQSTPVFVAETAAYALLSLCATQFFLLAYIATANSHRPLASLGYAVGAWLMSAFLLQFLPTRPLIGLVLFALISAACLRLGARFRSPSAPVKGKAGLSLLVLRGILAGILVAVVTTASQSLGSTGAGLLLAYPIGFTVVAVTVHQNYGAASVIATLHSGLLGTASIAGFCATVALLLPHWSGGLALGSALAVSVLITGALILRQRFVATQVRKRFG